MIKKIKANQCLVKQSGQALVAVLVLLLLGSLIIAPLLLFMGTSLKTGMKYDSKSDDLYAADSGIQDGLWRIKYDFMGVDYNPYDFETAWPYNTDNVNGTSANFSIMNVWFPSDVPTLESVGLTADEAKDMIDSGKLVVAGSCAMPGNPYSIKIDFTPDVGDNLTVKSLGVWLPQGFDYVPGSCSLQDGGPSAVYNPDDITVADAPGGQTILWSYDEDYPLYTQFPGVDDEAIPMTLIFTFEYTPPADHPTWLPTAIAWITTGMNIGSLGYANDNDVPVSWDVDTRFYKLISESGSTIVEAYSSKSELRQMGDAMSGDYVAIGNSLLSDDSIPKDNYRETWHTPSSVDLTNPTTVPRVPENADVAYAYLYWSGWRNDAAEQYPMPNDDCSTLTNWTRSYDAQNQIREPTADGDTSGSSDWTVHPCYDKVDETTPNDTDYITGTPDSGAYQLFTFSPFSIPVDAPIANLTVHFRAKDTSSGDNRIYASIKVKGTPYNAATYNNPGTSFTTYSYSFTTNPATPGVAWTVADLNGTGANPLQQFGVYSNDLKPDIEVSMVYAEVHFSCWAITANQFQGNGTPASFTTAQRTITLKNSVDLHSCAPTTAVVYWDQYGSGNLGSGDALYFAFSGDGGSTWSSNIEAFHDDPPTGEYYRFTYPVPSDYLTSQFKMRFYFNFNDAAKYVYLDNIKVIYMEPDTSITFKIGADQVYFNGSEPAIGAQPLTAGRSYAMFNCMNGVPEGFSYACVRDVSALVRKYPIVDGEQHHTGNALYTVGDALGTVGAVAADIYKSGTTKSNFAFAGWSLIIVYACPETAGRYIYIRDNNFAFHPGSTGSGSLDFDQDGEPGGIITNFVVPDPLKDENGNVIETNPAITLTCFVVEGDNFGTSSVHITGEQSGHDMDLWNTNSPSPDVFNGKSYPGTFNEGVDIDTFDVYWGDGILTPNDNELYVDMYSNGDAWNLVYFIISIRSETVTSGTNHYVIHGN